MRVIIITLMSVIIFSCTVLKNKESDIFIVEGYYFVVQISEIEKDTIYFETIEIYSPSILIDEKILNIENRGLSPDFRVNNKNIKVDELGFNKGLLKGAKKKYIGRLMLLYTNKYRIAKDGFITFDYIKNPELTKLSRLHRLSECYPNTIELILDQ